MRGLPVRQFMVVVLQLLDYWTGRFACTTAAASNSQVFVLQDGLLLNIYYPCLDNVCTHSII